MRAIIMHRPIICLLFATLPVTVASPAETTHDHQHDAQPAVPPVSAASPQDAMQKMRAMHEKMMAAKTPTEREALRAEHIKAMEQGMMSMKQMDATSCSPDGMAAKMRMNMMDMMMQMMKDQQAGRMSQPVAPQK